jgi:ubiquinone/menaquinone biosynthesis C-methylase UbiE
MDDAREHLEKIRDQFTRQADAYIRMRQTVDERTMNALASMTGVGPADRAIDVACGPGFLTMALATRCAAVIGIDATGELLSRARAEAERRGLRNIEFRDGDAEQLPFDDATFDAATCRAAFHHFVRPERVLAEMKRVVKPGRSIMIADMLTSEDPAKAEMHNRIERLCDPTHTRALSASEFQRLFAAAGLEVVMQPGRPIDYDVEEWLEHGGPTPETRREIIALMESWAEDDPTDLRVRRVDGKLTFSHTAAGFLLRAP